MPRPRKHPLLEIGHVQGALTVLKHEKNTMLICRCKCGKDLNIAESSLRKGQMSCKACSMVRGAKTNSERRGYAAIIPDATKRRKIQNLIHAVRQRCYDPRHTSQATYARRGIGVCPEWRFNGLAFMAYLVTLPGWDTPGLQLDRENNDRGYEPGNIRFVTPKINSNNTMRQKK